MKNKRMSLELEFREEADCGALDTETVMRDHEAVLDWLDDISGGYGEVKLVSCTIYPSLDAEVE